jgi:CheY-like chemotaxis protein
MNVNNHHQAIVLLVEDEPLVRMLAAEVLAEAGFRVVEAANADEALTLLQARPDVLVMISDVEMPGEMNGFALARAVRERASGVGIVVTSGRVAPQPGDMPANCLFLAKPHPLPVLVQKASELAALALEGTVVWSGSESDRKAEHDNVVQLRQA